MDSYVGLLDIEASELVVMILDSIKEVYEAIVIASFLSLMFAYLGIDPAKDQEVFTLRPLLCVDEFVSL